ncbi:hypothetical protein K1X84_01885 [bacterium]|nr:hypothetical protein [bacterium]
MKIFWLAALSIFIACTSGKNTPTVTMSATADSSKIVLVTKDEPGDLLVVSGTVYSDDGVMPVHGVRLFVYHTDQKGLYSADNDPRNPRIKGTLITDSLGSYEFLTIKPGAYPSGGVPAHIHFVVQKDGYLETKPEMLFEGDRYLRQTDYQREELLGDFGTIRKLAKDSAGVSRSTFNIKLIKKQSP